MLILGLMWGVRQILKLNQGPVGAGKYSFSIMRQQIKSKFQSERIKLIGKDGNIIDSILIPCNNMFNQLIIKENEEKEIEKLKKNEGSLSNSNSNTNNKNENENNNNRKDNSNKNSSSVTTTTSNSTSTSSSTNANTNNSTQNSSQNNSQNNSKRSTKSSPEFTSSPIGTVLFCSPNAGLYECLSQASKESSWVGYYCALGFDVCLFNYR